MGTRPNGQALETRQVFIQSDYVARRGYIWRFGLPSKMGVKMMIRKTIGLSHILAGALAVWGLIWLAFPASRWFEVRSVYVPDAQSGDFIPMAVDRAIHWPFTGEYRVEVRTFVGNTMACEAYGKVDYATDAELPEPLVLSWWAFSDPRCHDMPEGKFQIKTTWEVERLWGLIPDGEVVAVSNYFTVGEPQ